MPPGPTIPAPPLCRLCRRPITRATLTCPHCGARVSWEALERDGQSVRRPLRLRVLAYASGLALLVVIAALWLWVLREIKTPLSSSGESPSTSDRPSTTECANLIHQLKRTPANQGDNSELRDRLRQCLEGR